jgi:hypothetical protein
MYPRSTCGWQIAHNEEVNAGGWALKSPKALAFTGYYVQFFERRPDHIPFFFQTKKVQLKKKALSLVQLTTDDVL